VTVLTASPGSPLWYAAPSAGVVSLTLLTASLVLGMAINGGSQPGSPTPTPAGALQGSSGDR